MILFTADTDWASDEVLNFFFDEISKHDAKWLIFATNKNDRLYDLEFNGHHVGIHPNFIPCNSRSEMEKEVLRMKGIFPHAVFSRSHSLMTGGPIWDGLHKHGITHDFSAFQPEKKLPINRILWNGLTQVGFNWEDDYHFHSQEFDLVGHREIEKTVDLIVNFHPIHFFLNTIKKEDYLFYLKNKENSKLVREFQRKNWSNNIGCGKLLINLLNNRKDAVVSNPVEFVLKLPTEVYPWAN